MRKKEKKNKVARKNAVKKSKKRAKDVDVDVDKVDFVNAQIADVLIVQIRKKLKFAHVRKEVFVAVGKTVAALDVL